MYTLHERRDNPAYGLIIICLKNDIMKLTLNATEPSKQPNAGPTSLSKIGGSGLAVDSEPAV